MDDDVISRMGAIRELRLEYPTIPMFKELREEWTVKTEGYRKAQEVILRLPSAGRLQKICGYGEYCMCATCHYQKDCVYCKDCEEAQKQMHDIWTCTKYMRKEHLRKGLRLEVVNNERP